MRDYAFNPIIACAAVDGNVDAAVGDDGIIAAARVDGDVVGEADYVIVLVGAVEKHAGVVIGMSVRFLIVEVFEEDRAAADLDDEIVAVGDRLGRAAADLELIGRFETDDGIVAVAVFILDCGGGVFAGEFDIIIAGAAADGGIGAVLDDVIVAVAAVDRSVIGAEQFIDAAPNIFVVDDVIAVAAVDGDILCVIVDFIIVVTGIDCRQRAVLLIFNDIVARAGID